MKSNLMLGFICCLSIKAATQNVGIGTTTPTRAKLEVIGVAGAGNTSGIFGSDGPGISLQRNWPTIGFNQYRDNTAGQGKFMSNGFAAIQYFDPNSGYMAIDMFASGTANTTTPGGARGLTITPTGNIGIRTGVSNATLTVARGDGLDGTAVFAGTQHWSHFNYWTTDETFIRAGVDGSNVYINKIPSGDVFIGNGNAKIGINTLSPAATIDLVQPNSVHALSLIDAYGYSWHQRLSHVNVLNHGDGIVLELYYGGTAKGRFQYWDGNYVTYSDSRLKTNVVALSSVLDKLNKLNAVTYEINNGNPNHERSIGFVAQDVKPLFPHLVRQVSNKSRNDSLVTELHTMNYSGFGVIAIKALQEQWQQIQALEKETAELMLKLNALEKKLQ